MQSTVVGLWLSIRNNLGLNDPVLVAEMDKQRMICA